MLKRVFFDEGTDNKMTRRKCVSCHTCPVPLLLLLERSHTVSGDEASVELMRPKTNGSHFEGFHAFISYNFDIIKSQDSHNIATQGRLALSIITNMVELAQVFDPETDCLVSSSKLLRFR